MTTLQLLVLVGCLVLIVGVTAYGYWKHWQSEDDRRITALINGNTARPRPGMAQRDDTLLARAEERARARRGPRRL